MTSTQRSLVIAVFVVCAAAAGSVLAAPPPADEFGLRGLCRVELAFVNRGDGWAGVRGGVVPPDGGVAPRPPNEDFLDRSLQDDPECRAIAPRLRKLGLEVVERCRPDDPACGKLGFSVESQSIQNSADRMSLIGVELSQPVQLARDATVELSAPTTWSLHEVGIVAERHSATTASCIRFSGLAVSFATMWKVANLDR